MTEYIIVTNRGEGHITKPKALTYENVKLYDPEYVFSPFWSYYIKPEIYENFQCVSFHMTDLPYGRGGSPLQNLIFRGIKETQITAFKTSKGFDTGKIYMKHPLSLQGTADEIYDRAYDIIKYEMIPDVLKNKPVPQEQAGGRGEIFKSWTFNNLFDFIRMNQTDYENVGEVYLPLNNGYKLTLRIEKDE
jgi:methionyl-tRNA formyltransferase